MPTASIFKLADAPAAISIPQIRAGLGTVQVEALAGALQLTTNEVALILGISPKALLGQMKQGRRRLSKDVSEKLLRAARVRNAARKIFTTDLAVSLWLKEPVPALNGIAPIELLDTEAGTREVESVLMGIAYGNVL
jgi:putative toxin-antitoxin system antitoxin component (TIGR02293 family)